jgi:hypothetical protein
MQNPAPRPQDTPSEAELISRAQTLVTQYPQHFWFWKPGATIQSVEDVRVVVDHLRRYGDWGAWADAQSLQACLLRHFKRAS